MQFSKYLDRFSGVNDPIEAEVTHTERSTHEIKNHSSVIIGSFDRDQVALFVQCTPTTQKSAFDLWKDSCNNAKYLARCKTFNLQPSHQT